MELKSKYADTQLTYEVAKPKILLKTVFFYKGVELMGSIGNANYKSADIELTDFGVKLTSKKTKRIVGVGFSNIQAFEYFPEPVESKVKK